MSLCKCVSFIKFFAISGGIIFIIGWIFQYYPIFSASLLIVGCIFEITATFISVFFWRCPFCKKSIQNRATGLKKTTTYTCTYCGKQFKPIDW